MAVVLRLPDRSAAADTRSRVAGGQETAEILILPCIRRERLGRQIQAADCGGMPEQLQA